MGKTGSIRLILSNELYINGIIRQARFFFQKIYVCFWTKILFFLLYKLTEKIDKDLRNTRSANLVLLIIPFQDILVQLKTLCRLSII